MFNVKPKRKFQGKFRWCVLCRGAGGKACGKVVVQVEWHDPVGAITWKSSWETSIKPEHPPGEVDLSDPFRRVGLRV